MAEGRVVHNRPFLRSGDRRGGGGGGGGGGGRFRVQIRGRRFGRGRRSRRRRRRRDPQGETFARRRAQTRGQVRPRRRRRGSASSPASSTGARRGQTNRAVLRPREAQPRRRRRRPRRRPRSRPRSPPSFPFPCASPRFSRRRRRCSATGVAPVAHVPAGDRRRSAEYRIGGDGAAADRWASRVASVAADAERRRGYGCGAPAAAPHAGPWAAGYGHALRLSLLRGGATRRRRRGFRFRSRPRGASSPSRTSLAVARNSPRRPPARHRHRAPRRRRHRARSSPRATGPAAVDPRAPHYRFLEDEEAAAPAPSFGVSPEFGSSSALDNLAPCSDEIHCHPRSTARMPPPITPALLEPRGSPAAPRRRNLPRGGGGGKPTRLRTASPGPSPPSRGHHRGVRRGRPDGTGRRGGLRRERRTLRGSSRGCEAPRQARRDGGSVDWFGGALDFAPGFIGLRGTQRAPRVLSSSSPGHNTARRAPARRGVHVRCLGAPLPGVVGDSGVGSADGRGGAGGGASPRERERGGA